MIISIPGIMKLTVHVGVLILPNRKCTNILQLYLRIELISVTVNVSWSFFYCSVDICSTINAFITHFISYYVFLKITVIILNSLTTCSYQSPTFLIK